MDSIAKLLEAFDNLPFIGRLLLIIFFGGFICPVYRILKYFVTKNITTLIVGILCLVTGCGNLILEVIDIITTLTKGKITFCAD